MSRSGYSDDLDNWSLIRWRGAVESAARGKRGQQFFRELLDALDAMPEKILTANVLQSQDGEFCTLGVLGNARGLDMENLDPEDPERVAEAFGIARALTQEIVYMNDEWTYHQERPEARWSRMRAWVAKQIRTSTVADEGRVG